MMVDRGKQRKGLLKKKKKKNLIGHCLFFINQWVLRLFEFYLANRFLSFISTTGESEMDGNCDGGAAASGAGCGPAASGCYERRGRPNRAEAEKEQEE